MHKINTKLRIPLILSRRVFNSSWIIISTHQKRINKHICLHIFFTFITWKEKEEVTCSFSYLPSHNSHGFCITYLVLSLFLLKQLFIDEHINHDAIKYKSIQLLHRSLTCLLETWRFSFYFRTDVNHASWDLGMILVKVFSVCLG